MLYFENLAVSPSLSAFLPLSSTKNVRNDNLSQLELTAAVPHEFEL